MRYHWGMAVGHVYSHGHNSNTSRSSVSRSHTVSSNTEPESNVMADADHPNSQFTHHQPEVDSDTEDPELGFNNREDDDWLDMEGEFERELDERFDDNLLVTMDEMYNLDAPQNYYD